MTPIAVTAISTINALGHGLDATNSALLAGQSRVRACAYEDARLKTCIGRVEGVGDVSLDDAYKSFDCRNNRLAMLAMRADGFSIAARKAIDRYGTGKVAVVVGTSTSGVREGEYAFANRHKVTGELPGTFRFEETHDHHSLATFVRGYLGASGPSFTVSTACSSSAKVFADATQLLESGVSDAVIVGGADSLCLLTLYGFNSLELLSETPCRPNDANRSGISIGEGAGFALLERVDAPTVEPIVLLRGYGESADAYHMSAPHPDGLGAEIAMRASLERAGIEPRQVSYVNQHGTGTRQNDRAEDVAIARVFGDRMRCSSTKGATGHTLGAAGIVEAAICYLAIRGGFYPGNTNLVKKDPSLRSLIDGGPIAGPVNYALSNSFGFGGSNCSLLFGRP